MQGLSVCWKNWKQQLQKLCSESHCCNAGKFQMQLFSHQVCQMILVSG